MERHAFFKTNDEGHPVISEAGVGNDGKPVHSDRRLFMQFLSFGGGGSPDGIIRALEQSKIQGALYLDMNDPSGIGLMVASEDPNFFVDEYREFLNGEAFDDWFLKEDMTMMGRTYSIGYENDLEHVLVKRPVSRLIDPKLSWVVWYPLRRKGSFVHLPAKEQREILAEHGMIGNAFGQAGFANDIRLACHGLDKKDNDFVVGLLGQELLPLSAIVQVMRKTQQTSNYLENLGPFFIGRVAWQSK
jgi:chlorite dismutase